MKQLVILMSSIFVVGLQAIGRQLADPCVC